MISVANVVHSQGIRGAQVSQFSDRVSAFGAGVRQPFLFGPRIVTVPP